MIFCKTAMHPEVGQIVLIREDENTLALYGAEGSRIAKETIRTMDAETAFANVTEEMMKGWVTG